MVTVQEATDQFVWEKNLRQPGDKIYNQMGYQHVQ